MLCRNGVQIPLQTLLVVTHRIGNRGAGADFVDA